MNQFTATLIRVLTELHKRDVASIQASPKSRCTPLGHLSYGRMVDLGASLETGIKRVRQTKSYVPKVEDE